MTIELKLNEPTPPPPSNEGSVDITPEQTQNLISLISSGETPVLTLPEGKTFENIRMFSIFLKEDGSGRLTVRFRN